MESKAFIMITKKTLLVVLMLICCYRLFGRAQTDPNSWEKLNLSRTTIEEATVYYEKSLEPNRIQVSRILFR